MRTYRTFKSVFTPESYIYTVVNFKHRQTLAKFRCGNLKLKIETGRYSRPPLALHERKCILCQSGLVEDERHFLIDCEFYSDIRRILFSEASNYCPNFLELNPYEQFHYLMTSDDLQPILASSLYLMYRRRSCFTYI